MKRALGVMLSLAVLLTGCGLAAACLAGCGLAVVLVAGCADSFDIDSLHEEAKLSVSCFPSQSDTTWIEVTHTIPVAKGARKANNSTQRLRVFDKKTRTVLADLRKLFFK